MSQYQNLYYKMPINDVAFNVQFHIQIGYENGLIWTKTLKWATNCSIFATKKVLDVKTVFWVLSCSPIMRRQLTGSEGESLNGGGLNSDPQIVQGPCYQLSHEASLTQLLSTCKCGKVTCSRGSGACDMT